MHNGTNLTRIQLAALLDLDAANKRTWSSLVRRRLAEKVDGARRLTVSGRLAFWAHYGHLPPKVAA